MAGLFGSLTSALRRRETKAADISGLTWSALFGQQNSRAGVSVNVDSALKVSTVFACLLVLADGIAQVPLKVYRERADGSKELAKDHPTYRLLSRRPNEWMTSFEFRQVMMFHAVLLGNGCAYIGRIRGVPRELIPLVPSSYPIAYGDFARAYTLVDRLAMSLQRDNLTQATSGNVRFLFWKRVGGAVTLAEAIRKLKCST